MPEFDKCYLEHKFPWVLLERQIGKDSYSRYRGELTTLVGENRNYSDAIRLEGNLVHTLFKTGHPESKNPIFFDNFNYLISNKDGSTNSFESFIPNISRFSFKKSSKERHTKTKQYFRKVKEIGESNMEDLRKYVEEIKLYQGNMEEISKDLGVELKRVDRNDNYDKHRTFMQQMDDFWLRVEAFCVGADAVVHYQPGSAIGTPVKFVKKEQEVKA